MRKGLSMRRVRAKAPDHFDDANVLHVEDSDARTNASEPDKWTRPRKVELELPTLAVLTAAAVMALLYQATHPYELDTPPDVAAYAPWIESEAEPPASPALPPRPSPHASLVRPTPRTIAAHDAVPDVAGAWTLATHVDSSGYTPFEGLRLGFEVELEQNGDLVSGIGRKILENGDGIAARAQTPIAVNGTVDGDRVLLDFVEHGARRETQGRFVLTRAGDGALRGRFTTTAARSAGSAEARRVR